MRRGNFEDEDVICTPNGWLKEQLKEQERLNDNSSTTESALWRNSKPSAFQLQEIMLKSDNR